MRTTIDIPPGLHNRIKAHAAETGQSFTETATEALYRGMAPIEEPDSPREDPLTGLLVFNFRRGRHITNEEVADLIDEDM